MNADRISATAFARISEGAILALALAVVLLGVPGAVAQTAGDAPGTVQADSAPGAVQADSAPGARSEPLPDELEGVGITERLEAQLPLELTFTDAEERTVALGQYFDGTRPVILNLGYYGCPMLCGLVANGMAEALQQLKWTPGDEFTIVTLSFNPEESPTLAGLKKANYLRELGRPGAAGGWHFLTGDETNIRKLTETAGFHYRWNEERQEYAHAACLVICTPDGRISRYLYGIQFDPQTVRLSLVEAAAGKVGSSFDRFLLFCFQYDATAGRYGPHALKLMQAGGATAILVLGGFLTRSWRRERRRKRR